MKSLVTALILLLMPVWAMAGTININTATIEQLDEELEGVGKLLAQRIVSYREAHGPFREPQDIQKVPYIGVKTFRKNQAQIVVD